MEKDSKNTPNILLRKIREKRLLTIEDVASKVEVDERTVSRWEAGKSKPRPHALKELCKLFEATPEQLGFPQDSRSESTPNDTKHKTLDEETEYATLDHSASQTTSDLVSLPSMGQRSEYYNREKVGPRRSFRWLPYLTLGFLLLGLVAFSLIAVLSNREHPPSNGTTTSPYQTMDTFCRALIAMDFQKAYDQFSPSLQQQVPESAIAKRYLACSTSPSEITETNPQGTLLLTSGDRRKYWRIIKLQLDEQYIWKMVVYGPSNTDGYALATPAKEMIS